MRIATCGLLVGLMVFQSGCAAPPAPPSVWSGRIGKNCTVQFKRGAGLGAGGGLPVSPTTSNINGADVSLSGQLAEVSPDWIAVKAQNQSYLIPRDAILLVQFSD